MATGDSANPPSTAGSAPPPKPWERAPSSASGPTPFRPPSTGSTSAVVEASGTAKPGEVVTAGIAPTNTSSVVRPVPPRPWEQSYGNNYGGYGSMYNSGYGSGTYGGYGSSYGGGLYGNSMYRGGYGPYGNSMYGGGMYGSGYGGPVGGYGMGMGGPYGNLDPNNTFNGGPPSPPSFWMSFLRVMEGVVNFFGRIAMLIDQNTQAFHFFMSALLQLFDRSGVLYGELARFVFRILGIRMKSRKPPQVPGPGGISGQAGQQFIEGPKTSSASGSLDNVWADNGGKSN